MSQQANQERSEPAPPDTEETTVAQEQPAAEEAGRLTIVAIGASAGGLAALQGFFDPLPPDSGMAFVVITHMDPQRETLLPGLLQKQTAMPVHQVRQLTPIEADNVYVISPNRRIRVTDTHLAAEDFEEPRGRRTPVDFFFRSLADVHRESIAVILSGGGTDGAVGVKAIKEEGGLLLVQDPAEAEHDSMPRAAINTGLADMVLPVAELAERLVAYRRNGVRLPRTPEALTPQEMNTLIRILTVVQAQTGHDFSQYKRSTLLRRIQRRMQLNGHQTLDAYLGYLRHDGAEAQALFNDLLIGVTNFFRDKDAWQALAETVIPPLFADKEQGDTVRVWSIGCATGEEAYSLAILLLEHRDRLEAPTPARPNVQVFASDLDDAALDQARHGLYPEAIEADVSPERLERWFIKEGHHYQVRQELRDMVLFSSHSVLRDPPFSRLDLISCRNLLIYLNRELQENVFQVFHYALKPESYLFLGNSESADVSRDLFHTLDKSHRIYRARPRRSDLLELPALPLTVRPAARRRQTERRRATRWSPPGESGNAAAYHLEILEDAAPPSALVDETYTVLNLSATAGRYLRLPGGAISNNLLELVRPKLKAELRTALFQAFAENESAVGSPISLEIDGVPCRVTLAVRLRDTAAEMAEAATDAAKEDKAAAPEERLALVFFLEEAAPAADAGNLANKLAAAKEEGERNATQRESLVAHLEEEVRRLRQRLQATTEEYESANEELKAANEELQSINEEYRSTTEELETSKEELQSVNEELQTVNAELKNKLEETSRAHSDLENLMLATNIATLFLDRQLRIQRYTSASADLFNVIPSDRGRPLSHLTNRLQYDHLTEDAVQVLKTLIPIEREVQDRSGRWFLAQLRPYRTMDDRIDGVVLTFIEVTDLKEVEAALRQSEERYRALATSTSEVIYRMSPDWSEMHQLYGQDFLADTAEPNRTWLETYIPPEARPRVLAAIAEAIRTKSVFELEHRVVRADGSVGWTASRAAPLLDGAGAIVEWIGAARDITERKEATAEVERARTFMEKIVDTVREGLLVLRPDLTVEFANDSFYEMFRVEPAEIEGELIYQLGNGQWDIPELRRLLEEILPQEKVFNDYRVAHEFDNVGRRVMLLNGRRLDALQRVLLAIEDVTGKPEKGGKETDKGRRGAP